MVTRDDGFSWVQPRISRDDFIGVLQTHAYPGVIDERPCGEYYDAINGYHVDPLLVLAIFNHESTMGASGVARTTHSWGNMRQPTDPANGGGSVTVPGRGVFASYDDWLKGCADTAAHLDTQLYRGLTISDAIYHWAPPSDSNDTEGYIHAVVDFMNRYQSKGATMARIILSAGHENIGELVGNDGGKLGGDAERLSHGTGAHGEESLNVSTVQRAIDYLARVGVQAVHTDARYSDEYATGADLVVFVHGDGVNDPNAPQHAGCVPVISNDPTQAAKQRAQAFCDTYKSVAPQFTGITNENLDTADMDYLYNGDFLNSDTPAAIVETCIVGWSGGVRSDALTPDVAGYTLARAVYEWGVNDGCIQNNGQSFPMAPDDNGVNQPSSNGDGTGGGSDGTSKSGKWYTDERGFQSIRFDETGGKLVSGGFGEYIHSHGYRDGATDGTPDITGYPLTNEFVAPAGFFRGTPSDKPITCQIFERAVLLFIVDDDKGNGHVDTALVGHRVLTDLVQMGAAPNDAWRY